MAKSSNLVGILSVVSNGKCSFEFKLNRDDAADFVDWPNRYRHMFFVTGNPAGSGDEKYNRSRDAAITMAVDPHNILSFAQQIRLTANRTSYGRSYSMKTNPSNSKNATGDGMKSMYVGTWTPSGKDVEKEMNVSIGMSWGDKKMGNLYSVAEAVALSNELEFLAMKALEEEFKIKTKNIGYTKGKSGSQSSSSSNSGDNSGPPDDIFGD